ncbi:MFS transporter (plasmid) [Tistrella bauzanensis]|uniref:MFS transporter n=1 Tax=Tistrella bauzanensis TaxID=657419 RepID=UPI001E5A16E0|nr:MFS transporter [Tistrella bauzanensis]
MNATRSQTIRATDAGTEPGLILIGALYLAQGLPIGFAFEALPVLLRQAGIPLAVIAWVPLAGLPWVLKPLWAPLVDNHGGARIGRRRAWIIPMQLVLAASMAGLAVIDATAGMALWIVALTLIASTAAATQDIATDGLAAVLLLAGLTPVLSWAEPPASARPASAPARVGGYFRRPGGWALLAAALFFGLPYSGVLALSKLWLSDAGMALGRIGLVGIAGSLAMMALGCPLAAQAIRRFGTGRTLAGGLAIAIVGLLLWTLAVTGITAATLAGVLPAALVLGLGGGVASVAASTVIMRFAAGGDQTGTDVTVAQAVHVFSETMTGSVAITLAAAAGYAGALSAITLASLAGIAVIALMLRRMPG